MAPRLRGDDGHEMVQKAIDRSQPIVRAWGATLWPEGQRVLGSTRFTAVRAKRGTRLSRQCLDDYFETREQLAETIAAWERPRNESNAGIDWRFTTDDARIKLKALYPSISVG